MEICSDGVKQSHTLASYSTMFQFLAHLQRATMDYRYERRGSCRQWPAYKKDRKRRPTWYVCKTKLTICQFFNHRIKSTQACTVGCSFCAPPATAGCGCVHAEALRPDIRMSSNNDDKPQTTSVAKGDRGSGGK